jgi:hypothetical protein
MTRPHFSISQLAMWERCPAQFEKHYILGESKPPGIAALKGSGVHSGRELAMRHKAMTFVNLGSQAVVDASVAGFDERIEQDDVFLTPEEKSAGRLATIGRARDAVAALSSYWSLVSQPDYQPLDATAIEKEFLIPLPTLSRDVLGYIDLIANDHKIIDWKTSARSRKGEERTSLQLTCYSLAHRREFGFDPQAVVLDVVREGSHTSREVLSSTRNDADYEALLRRIQVTIAAIDKGSFPPCSPDHWACDARWCGWFRNGCRYIP